MGILQWASDNWFSLIQTLGIIAGLAFTAASFRIDTKTRQISNLLTVTGQHREIWKEFYRHPELSRVLEHKPDLEARPLSNEEELFVRLLILHLSSTFEATRDNMYLKPKGLERDVQLFFSLPIPKTVWNKFKVFQNDGFVRFIEDQISTL
jgi:hypothetical protein